MTSCGGAAAGAGILSLYTRACRLEDLGGRRQAAISAGEREVDRGTDHRVGREYSCIVYMGHVTIDAAAKGGALVVAAYVCRNVRAHSRRQGASGPAHRVSRFQLTAPWHLSHSQPFVKMLHSLLGQPAHEVAERLEGTVPL